MTGNTGRQATRKGLTGRRLAALLAGACLLLGHATLAPAKAQGDDFAAVTIQTEKLADSVYVLFGAGGNIGVSVGPDGVFLVDDQYAPLTERIVAAVAKLSDQPVRFVINTHWHGDHSGGNENFGKAGALIVAQDQVRARMATSHFSKMFQRTTPPSPEKALPVITFSHSVTFHLNGEPIQLVHVPAAHTDGDSLVYFSRSNVLHMGDTYFNGVSLPFVDASSGGTIDGMIAAVAIGLETADDATRIIPGHGPVASRADMQDYHDMLRTARSRVAAEAAAGMTRERLTSPEHAATYSALFEGVKTDGFISPATFLGFVYDGVTAAIAAAPDGLDQ